MCAGFGTTKEASKRGSMVKQNVGTIKKKKGSSREDVSGLDDHNT